MLTLPLSSFLRAPTLIPYERGPHKRCCYRNSKPCAIVGPAGLVGTYLTARSKINRSSSFCPNVLGVELDLDIFLLVTGDHENWIAQVIIVEVEGRLVVPAAVSEHRRSNRDSRILDDYLVVRNRTAFSSTDVAFYGKPVVHLVHRNRRGWKINTPTESGGSEAEHCSQSGRSRYAPGSVPHVPRRPYHRLYVVFFTLPLKDVSTA